MKNNLPKLLLILALPLLTSGCFGSRESDEIAYVMSVGFDKAPGGDIMVTFQIANPLVLAQASGARVSQNQQPYITSTVIAPVPLGALNILNTMRSREISLLHAKAYIFSEDLAREGLEHYILPLHRFQETRATSSIFICKGKARDFIKNNIPLLEFSPSKQYEHFLTLSQTHGLSPVNQFHHFYQAMKTMSLGSSAALVGINSRGLESDHHGIEAIGRYIAGEMPSDKGNTQFLGTAVFMGDRMVGELNGRETRCYNILTGEFRRGIILIRDPINSSLPVGLSVSLHHRPKVRFFLDDQPRIDVKLHLDADIVGLPSGINYESPEKKTVLEKALRDMILEESQFLVARSQEEFRSDIFGFGQHAQRGFLTNQQWERLNWGELYPDLTVNIEIEVIIHRTGLMLETQPIQNTGRF